MSSENKMPVAGLRVLCCRQDISTTTPFDDATFNAIHTALGIPSGHEYLTRLNAGACGKYLLGSAQQGKFQCPVSIPFIDMKAK
jgi:hypothetical protein